MPPSLLSYRLAALAAALLFSTGGAAIKAASLTGWQVACFRSGIAAATLLLLVPTSRRRWNPEVILASLAYAATLVTFVVANKLTTSANAIFLQCTGPLYLLILSPWLLREPVRRRDLAVMAFMAAGMGMVLLAGQSQSATAPDPVKGNWVGVITGIAWAFTLVALRRLGSREGSGGSAIAAVSAGNLVACLATLPQAFPLGEIGAADWMVLAYLGTVQIAVAYLLLTYAVRRLSALETSLLVLAEPALNPVWTFLVHGERPVQLALLGGLLILAATLSNLVQSSAAGKASPAQH